MATRYLGAQTPCSNGTPHQDYPQEPPTSNVWKEITLKEDTTFRGLYGIRHTTRAVSVGVDEPERLIEALGKRTL